MHKNRRAPTAGAVQTGLSPSRPGGYNHARLIEMRRPAPRRGSAGARRPQHRGRPRRVAPCGGAVSSRAATASAAVLPETPSDRVGNLDWRLVYDELDRQGSATIQRLLTVAECRALAALYSEDRLFRSRVVMGRHGFGQGEYKYFSYPLPELVANLRAELYSRLAPLANRWNSKLKVDAVYPPSHAAFLAQCRDFGQCRPTPLLLKYRDGDYNCLHQDLYGDCAFPLQVAILLAAPGVDFTGGEFVLAEQRPRMQSRPEVVSLHQGDAVVFAVHHRPVQGVRRAYRVSLRHGVSRVRSGCRYTLGIIFHDAR